MYQSSTPSTNRRTLLKDVFQSQDNEVADDWYMVKDWYTCPTKIKNNSNIFTYFENWNHSSQRILICDHRILLKTKVLLINRARKNYTEFSLQNGTKCLNAQTHSKNWPTNIVNGKISVTNDILRILRLLYWFVKLFVNSENHL